MSDYPSNLLEFDEKFQTEVDCRTYLEGIRWPNGFCCPRCGNAGGWPNGRPGLWECSECHHQTSVTAGTILDKTRKPLRLWFLAMWLIVSEKNGISASGLQRQSGLTRYETVWVWLHKLRRAMVRPGRDMLTGRLEVDETYVGGVAEGKRGRGAKNKHIVVIAAEENGIGIGTSSSRSSCCLTSETLVAGNSSRCREREIFGLLPRRIYISIQPSNLKTSWQTVLPSHSANGVGRSRNMEKHCSKTTGLT